jgi:hypothetical protein
MKFIRIASGCKKPVSKNPPDEKFSTNFNYGLNSK